VVTHAQARLCGEDCGMGRCGLGDLMGRVYMSVVGPGFGVLYLWLSGRCALWEKKDAAECIIETTTTKAIGIGGKEEICTTKRWRLDTRDQTSTHDDEVASAPRKSDKCKMSRSRMLRRKQQCHHGRKLCSRSVTTRPASHSNLLSNNALSSTSASSSPHSIRA